MIQEKDFLYRVPVKTAPITTPRGQIRNPEILVDLEGGEFMHGNILDANSTNKLINRSVKDAVDDKFIESGYVTKDLLEAETSARTNGDEDLGAKIKAEQTRAEGKEKEISDKLAIVDGDSNTEGSFRKAIADVIAAAPEDLDTLKEIADKLADNDDLHTALNKAITEKADASALANEVTRATGAESGLQAAISAKQDAGNYIPYDASVQGQYQIDKVLAISIDNAIARVEPGSLYCSNGASSIDINSTSISLTDDGNNILLGRSGIFLPNGSYDYVLTSNGSTINIKNYATQSDLSSQLGPKADRSDLAALEQKVTANAAAIEGKQDKGNYVTYTDYSDSAGYAVDKHITITGSNTTNKSKLGEGFLTVSGGSGTNEKFVKYDINGITCKQSHNCLATSDGTFKPIFDFVLKTDAGEEYVEYNEFASVKAALNAKQNKLKVHSVDVTNLDTADITQLREIVKGLLNALSDSGLIIQEQTIE